VLITGKAERDFYKWLFEKHNLQPYNIFNRIFTNALIIEWFDSVGIYINIIGYSKTKWRVLVRSNYDEYFNSRQQATEEAIKKANEIYNKE
jgi:hypothetical protein